MNKQTFQQFMEARQFKVYGMNAFGVMGEYPVNVVASGSRLWNFVFAVDMTDAKQQLKELRKENKKKYAFAQHNFGLAVSVTMKDQQAEQDYDTVVRELTAAFRQKGIRPAKTCPFCKQGDCDVLVAHGVTGQGMIGYVPAHRHCVDNMAAQTVDKAQKNEENGNYITGVIGAILGAIVGTLPSLFTILAMEKIYAVLFALIPLCIYGGYKLLKGKMNKFVIALTVILSILSIILLNMEELLYYLVHDYGLAFGEAFTFLGEIVGDGQFWAELLPSNIMAFVFIGLGILIAWGQISKTGASEIHNVEEIRKTMIPYGEDNLFQ